MINKEDLFINIEYSFSSNPRVMDESHYTKEVKAMVYNESYDEDDEEISVYIGEVNLKILNLNQATDDKFSIYQVFDTYEYTFRHGQSFYDFEENDFNKAFHKHYNEILFNDNICIIETMSILPAYRGMGVGFQVFQDLVHNFKRDSSLFILQPYPLQFDETFENKEKKDILGLENFEKDEAKAFKKLTEHYKSWGLEKIKGIDDLLFFNAELSNKKFDRACLK